MSVYRAAESDRRTKRSGTAIVRTILVSDMGLVNTRWALILPWTSGGQVFGILVCRGFFSTLPQELFDAGKIDGCHDFDLYWRVALPLSWPIMVTISIMHLVGTYDFLWPLLVISSPEIQVVSIGLREFTSQFGITDWGPRMAAYTVATIPLVILFLFGMRYYIQGITSGAIKAQVLLRPSHRLPHSKGAGTRNMFRWRYNAQTSHMVPLVDLVSPPKQLQAVSLPSPPCSRPPSPGASLPSCRDPHARTGHPPGFRLCHRPGAGVGTHARPGQVLPAIQLA